MRTHGCHRALVEVKGQCAKSFPHVGSGHQTQVTRLLFGRNLYLIDPVCAPYDLFLKRQAEPLLSQPSRQLLGAGWRLGKRVRARLAASGRRLTLYPLAVCSQCLCVTTVCAAWQLRELRNLKYSNFERISVLFQALLEAGEEGVEV